MAFSSLVRTLAKAPLTLELSQKLDRQGTLDLRGMTRLPKGAIASALAQQRQQHLLLVCPTLEEGGKWAAQLEAMGWGQVLFYPTSEASPYGSFDLESEMIWGQLQVLATLIAVQDQSSIAPGKGLAIVATERALQPHLPPPRGFAPACVTVKEGEEWDLETLGDRLSRLGYERVSRVESEGQWARRGEIVDLFPVSAELPLRLEWFGDRLERLRELDPASQKALDRLDQLVLTPTSFAPLIGEVIADPTVLPIEEAILEQWIDGTYPEGMQRFLGHAFNPPASLVDYLPPGTCIVLDEPHQCQGHGDRWYEETENQWRGTGLVPYHRPFRENLDGLKERFPLLTLGELAETDGSMNLASRPLPVTPHQFAKLGEMLRGKREVYPGLDLKNYQAWLVSAQPSRSVALLQEHDCPAQFVPNPQDVTGVEKLHTQKIAVALKYSGQAELEGFILPPYRLVVVTDREFFGQHSLANVGYVRKRRRAASTQVDPNQLRPGNYVVHRTHGVGRFLKLEKLESREYLVVQYADGLLRVPADALDVLSRYRHTGSGKPELHKMTGKTWEKAKAKARNAIKKLAFDLLKLYAQRSEKTGFAYPIDTPWQQELEDSFPYIATADQLKAVQDIKRDLESDRPMDRLVCGDVGFGKTEVAIRAIFKAVTSGHKQVVLLAPTTILTQQHYHTLKERFAPYPITVGLLNRFRTASERQEILQRLAAGELDIVVATQQILSKEVKFRDLGLLVIDEEQRFGVNQKEKIKALKTQVDVLTLSATPIPRTLYMSLSGIREMSLITTPPPSRRPIQTHLSPHNWEVIRTAIRNELDRGGQGFYVMPRIEGMEEVAGKLREMIPSLRLAIAHGQMEEGELESTMLSFNNGDADLLLCTTIVESGLDIPRVNTIIVEDAQKFGLAQLYQLRGRVGRSGVQAHAWLLYPSQIELSETARKRLRALQEFSQLGSGYQLAMRDMEIRGVGNLLGAEQSGQMEAIGFELYMEMLQEAFREIQGQEIPQVDDCQVDLKLMAFIPASYISDDNEKLDAYRLLTTANSKPEWTQIAAQWSERYGPLPESVQQLFLVVELKHLAKGLGISRIKPEGKQNIMLETPMEEPAWQRLAEHLPEHLRSRFVYTAKKITVRGVGALKLSQQLENLMEWLGKMQDGLEKEQP